jgi:hypothetical protein
VLLLADIGLFVFCRRFPIKAVVREADKRDAGTVA